jgi:Uncharacterized proteins, LmbE homologs
MEALRAAAILQVREVSFLGHPDGELDRLPPGYLRAQFMRAIRERQPDTLFTFDPFAPFEDHPDHRAVAFAALEAANFAPYPLYHPEQIEGYRARIRNHGHSCFLCEIVIRSQFHTTYEPEA